MWLFLLLCSNVLLLYQLTTSLKRNKKCYGWVTNTIFLLFLIVVVNQPQEDGSFYIPIAILISIALLEFLVVSKGKLNFGKWISICLDALRF